MRAIVVHRYGGPEELKWEDYGDPAPGAGEVLIRVAVLRINPLILSPGKSCWWPANSALQPELTASA